MKREIELKKSGKILDEINLCAEIFIRSSSDECDESVFETYEFTFEELKVFLFCFASGLFEQLINPVKSLYECAKCHKTQEKFECISSGHYSKRYRNFICDCGSQQFYVQRHASKFI